MAEIYIYMKGKSYLYMTEKIRRKKTNGERVYDDLGAV